MCFFSAKQSFLPKQIHIQPGLSSLGAMTPPPPPPMREEKGMNSLRGICHAACCLT